MGRADLHFVAYAIAVALLAGAGGAVAAADTGDSAGSESTNNSDSASGTDQAADHTDASTYASGANANTAGDQPGDTAQNTTGGEEGGEKKPVDDDSGTDNGPGDRTISRVPTLLPQAPPPVDLAPLPEEVPPPPLAPVLPPIDVPPGVPAEPEPVDAMGGASAVLHGGNKLPVLTAPVIVAPVPALPGHILGASIAPRATFGGPAFTSTSRWAGEPAPPIRQPSTSEPLLREPPPTNAGLTARGQTSKEAGYTNEYVRSPRLSEMAAGALPGVAGMLIMTASGVCLGYRQAMAGQLLRPQGADRFLA
jgi:hypothetical protein